tara:strand:- start:3311 stop:4537 length:1227 start_codon:yes stop_codon:yes gene_type:complete
MPAPSVEVTIRFSGGPSFGTTLVLGDALGKLGESVLGTSSNLPIDFSNKTRKVVIRRGRTRVLDKFESGSCSLELVDTDGAFDPTGGSYDIKPLHQVRVSATHGGTERFLFSGYIVSWTYNFRKGAKAAWLNLECMDGFRLLNLAKFTSLASGTAGQTTGTRMGEVLDAINFPSTQRDIDTGDTTVQADDGTERTALDAVQLLSETELGGVYMTGEGDVKFVSRSEAIKALDGSPTVFDDDGTDIAYEGVALQIDERLLRNKISVTRSGGSVQTVSDATSITNYFERNMTRTGLLMQTNADALSQANAILSARKDPDLRVQQLTIDATADNSARISAALDLDFYSPITVNRSYPNGTRTTKTLTVQGVQHTITPSIFKTTFTTTEPLVAGFILGSSLNGVLGTSVLAY